MYGHEENRDEVPRRGFLAVFLTRGHPTARFLNQMSAAKGVSPPGRRTSWHGAVPMADSPKSIARRKWGRFLPHQRANVDQVPLPFVNDMEVTYGCGRLKQAVES